MIDGEGDSDGDGDARISEDCFIFEVFKERASNLHIFGGGGFQKFNLVLERLAEWNLWQVTIFSEALNRGMVPEEVFLLENVEQIMVGPDRKMQDLDGNKGRNMLLRISRMGTISRASEAPKSSEGRPAESTYFRFCMRSANRHDNSNVYVVLKQPEAVQRLIKAIEVISAKSLF